MSLESQEAFSWTSDTPVPERGSPHRPSFTIVEYGHTNWHQLAHSLFAFASSHQLAMYYCINMYRGIKHMHVLDLFFFSLNVRNVLLAIPVVHTADCLS